MSVLSRTQTGWGSVLLHGLAAAAMASLTAVSASDASMPELGVCAAPANLPFSNERQEGFENRIAEVIAEELGASVRYSWSPQRRGFLRRTLRSGSCDVVIGIPAGLPGVGATRAYYTSSYVFVTASKRGLQLGGFDDPALRQLKIGVQLVAAEGANPPPALALARRGILDNVIGYPTFEGLPEESPEAAMLEAVASGEIDVAIAWGPAAGPFAKQHPGVLTLTPIASDPQLPSVSFTYGIALGMRSGDTALKATLEAALDRRQPEIDAILDQYGVPRVPTQVEVGRDELIAEHH